MVLCVLNIQPGLLGMVSNKPLTLLSCLLALYLLSSSRSKGNARVPLHVAITLLLMIFLSLRVLLDDRAMETAHVGYMFITFSLAAVGALAGEAVTHSGNQRLALKVFVYFIAVLSISACVTALISTVFPLLKLQLATFTIVRPDNSVKTWLLYFPFTVTNAEVWFGNHLVPRLSGAYREPGIFQMYLLMALVITQHTTIRYQRAVRVFVIIALLLTFSSIGYPLAVVTAAYALFSNKRRTLLTKTAVAAMAILALVAIWQLGPLAYEKKVYDAQDTSESRVTAVANSISHLIENPLLGTGFFVDQPDDLGLEGVSVIASMHMFGLIGLVLYAGVIVAALRRNDHPSTATMLLPLLGTLVFSQPLHFDAITFFMLGLNLRGVSKPLRSKARTRARILGKKLLCEAPART